MADIVVNDIMPILCSQPQGVSVNYICRYLGGLIHASYSMKCKTEAGVVDKVFHGPLELPIIGLCSVHRVCLSFNSFKIMSRILNCLSLTLKYHNETGTSIGGKICRQQFQLWPNRLSLQA